jgi:hypothetical protein
MLQEGFLKKSTLLYYCCRLPQNSTFLCYCRLPKKASIPMLPHAAQTSQHSYTTTADAVAAAGGHQPPRVYPLGWWRAVRQLGGTQSRHCPRSRSGAACPRGSRGRSPATPWRPPRSCPRCAAPPQSPAAAPPSRQQAAKALLKGVHH